MTLDLPHVLLEHVAGYLCAREYSNFALTSRACHAAAAGVRVVPLVATNEIVRRLRAGGIMCTEETIMMMAWIMRNLCAKCPHLVLPASVERVRGAA